MACPSVFQGNRGCEMSGQVGHGQVQDPLHDIVAVTDFSDSAHDAVFRAGMLAVTGEGRRLGIVHALRRGMLDALHDLLAREDDEALLREADERARVQLDTLRVELAEALGLRADTELVRGRAARVIDDYARQRDAGLLVLGECNEGFVTELLLGTMSERLLGRTSRALLVVRSIPRLPYQRVLVPVDFSPDSLHALDLLSALAPQAQKVLMFAAEMPYRGLLDEHTAGGGLAGLRAAAESTALQRLRALAESHGLSEDACECVVMHGEPGPAVLTCGERVGCDLIAMGKHGRNRLADVMIGSVTRHVMGLSPCDVLVAT